MESTIREHFAGLMKKGAGIMKRKQAPYIQPLEQGKVREELGWQNLQSQTTATVDSQQEKYQQEKNIKQCKINESSNISNLYCKWIKKPATKPMTSETEST